MTSYRATEKSEESLNLLMTTTPSGPQKSNTKLRPKTDGSSSVSRKKLDFQYLFGVQNCKIGVGLNSVNCQSGFKC
jgi:hypothetical protein